MSNSYVVTKLRVLLFPWRHKPWLRKTRRSDNGQLEFLTPMEDPNAPDLYIPRTHPYSAPIIHVLMPKILLCCTCAYSDGICHLYPCRCPSLWSQVGFPSRYPWRKSIHRSLRRASRLLVRETRMLFAKHSGT